MYKKIYNIIFIVLFLAVFFVPFLLTDWHSGGVSQEENRNLAQFPALTQDGRFNDSFTGEFETWYMDHMGLRQKMIDLNVRIQYDGFGRMISNSHYKIGAQGELNYATPDMVQDYAHLNLRTPEEVARIGSSYQAISDEMAKRGIPFYYVQCYDKHTIYPEQFIDTVQQVGDISKTDQVISYLQTGTTVSTISLKEPLLQAKERQRVFSCWGDPTHWNPTGAYVGYRYMMERINEDFGGSLKVLAPEDYTYHSQNDGLTLNNVIHQDDWVEHMTVTNPAAKKDDVSVMGKWVDQQWHSVWKNPDAGNDTKLLLMGDSYFNNYIVDDIAESFSEVWFIWADYTADLMEIVEVYQPDIVIYECAERVDRSNAVVALADTLK